jgi:hypothetical protein
LNTTVKVDDTLSAFIQMQSATRFGILGFPRGVTGHAGLSDPSDNSTDVGMHQAYFVQKNLFGLPVNIKAGRQEIVIDGHRLFGHTGWTTGAQAHDALMLEHAHDNMTLRFYFSKQVENAAKSDGGDFASVCLDDKCDNDYLTLWGNYKGLIGDKSSTSVYVVYADTDGSSPSGFIAPPGFVITTLDADFWTFGARQAGSVAGIDYRVEGYIQEGKNGVANASGVSGDSSGYLFAGRIGKKFGNVMWKPKLTLWGDYLSGTSIADAAAGDTGSFNTLFDTGHKFYGFMDFFLGTQGLGLIDLAVKTSIQPMAKTTIKLDYHHFQRTEEAVVGGPETLGQELDITVVYKYSANMKMVAGYSSFFARDNFLGAPGATAVANYDDAQWLYLMLDMKF